MYPTSALALLQAPRCYTWLLSLGLQLSTFCPHLLLTTSFTRSTGDTLSYNDGVPNNTTTRLCTHSRSSAYSTQQRPLRPAPSGVHSTGSIPCRVPILRNHVRPTTTAQPGLDAPAPSIWGWSPALPPPPPQQLGQEGRALIAP